MAIAQEKAMGILRFFETKHVFKIQRRYRTQYGKDSPLDNSIRRWLMQFQETGNVLYRKGARRPGTFTFCDSSQVMFFIPPLRLVALNYEFLNAVMNSASVVGTGCNILSVLRAQKQS
jgi:hypothetical protein